VVIPNNWLKANSAWDRGVTETAKAHEFDPADRIDAHDPVSGEFESGREWRTGSG